MNIRAFRRAAWPLCAAALSLVSPASADTITTPTDLSYATVSWQAPCLYEYGPVGPDCGGYYETNQNFVSSAIEHAFVPQVDGYLTVTGNTDANFAFQEVDSCAQACQSYANALDYVTFNNGTDTGSVTITPSSLSNSPLLFAGPATTLYSYSPFNSQGQLLGSTSSVATRQNEEYLNVFYPTYSALAGSGRHLGNRSRRLGFRLVRDRSHGGSRRSGAGHFRSHDFCFSSHCRFTQENSLT